MKEPTARTCELLQVLRPPPPVLDHLWQLLGEAKAGADDLVAVLGCAPYLTANLIRSSNASSRSGQRRARIDSLKSAVTLLGFHQVMDIALTVVIRKWLHPGRPAAVGFDRQAFWRHCLSCGIAADHLARRARVEGAEMAFAAGLTHDLGALILDAVAPEVLGALIARELDGGDVGERERALLGCGRAEMGGEAAALNGFPERLIGTVRGRCADAGGAGEAQPLGDILRMADALATDPGALRDGMLTDHAEICRIGQDVGLDAAIIERASTRMLDRLIGTAELIRLPMAA